MHARKSLIGAALLAAGGLILAGCSSSGGSAGAPNSSSPSSHAAGSTSNPTANSAGASGAGGLGFHPITDFAGWVGGSGKANSSLSPVYIGAINQQGGSADIAPEWTNGAELAAAYINNEAGGIGGHPIKLVKCFIPDQVANAAQCGQQMANDKKVQAAAVGAVTIGNEAMEKAIEPTHKALFFGIATSPVDTTYPDGYILFGDSSHVESPFGTFIKEYLHAKNVSIVYANIPGSDTSAKIIADSLRYEGVSVKIIGYDPKTSDLTVPLIAAKAASADLLVNGAASPSQCSGIYHAVKKLNITTPVIANVPCDSSLVAKGDGGQLPIGWYYASAKSLPGDPADPTLTAFAKVAGTYGQSKYASDNWTADAFVQILTIAKMDTALLKAGKQITAANINAEFKAYQGGVPMGAPTLECGSFKDAPAVCNDKDSFFQNTAPGVFKAVARFIGPPKGYKLPPNLR